MRAVAAAAAVLLLLLLVAGAGAAAAARRSCIGEREAANSCGGTVVWLVLVQGTRMGEAWRGVPGARMDSSRCCGCSWGSGWEGGWTCRKRVCEEWEGVQSL